MCGGYSSASSSSAINRKDFIKLSGAGIAGMALFGIMGSGGVTAQTGQSLSSEFEAAAGEFDIPVELLLAMGWVNTRWEMPPPEVSEYEEGNLHGMGLYGIMALVQNPSADTLGEASELTGIPEEKLKSDRASNIRGGAALLAKSRQAISATSGSMDRALQAVEGTPAASTIDSIAGVGGGELYRDQVLEALRNGVSGETGSGERLAIPAQEGVG